METDDKPVYVTLETMVPTRENDDGTLLVKKVAQYLIQGTVGDLVAFMLAPGGDSLNEPYNAAERDVAGTVSRWFEEMNQHPNDYSVSVMALDSNGNEIPMNLDEKVCTYESAINIKEETNPQNGAAERYKIIDMFAKRSVPGGYSLLEDTLRSYER